MAQQTAEHGERQGPDFRKTCSLLVAAAALVLFFLPPPDGVSITIMRTGALTLFAIGFWATAVWPIGLTAIAYFLLASVMDIQPTAVVFSGFTSKALWLVFGGLVIGASVGYTKLGERLARSLVNRFGGSYLAVISGIALVCMVLGFVMPSSMGRIVLLTPIIMALADQLGFAPGSRGRSGMVLATALITFTSAGTILPALVPGMALAGLAENLYGMQVTYGRYLFLNFPVLGVVKCAVIVLLTVWLFGEQPQRDQTGGGHSPMAGGERLLTLILIGALALWVSDFLHGISAAWVALGAAVLILMPGLNLLPPKAISEKIGYNSVFYVAAVLGMSAVLSKTGLASLAGQWFLAVVPFEQGSDGVNYGYLSAISSLIPLAVTNPGVPAVLSPLAQDFAAATGLPLESVLMTQVVGFTNAILPYQASPIVVAMAMGGVRMADGAKLTLWLTAAGMTVLVPLNYLWWVAAGLFG